MPPVLNLGFSRCGHGIDKNAGAKARHLFVGICGTAKAVLCYKTESKKP
jgi:hypothetical protein